MISYHGRRVTVVGMARSGVAAARLLKKLGAFVSVTEKGSSASLKEAAASLEAEGISVELGAHTPAFISGRDLVVVSPGVRPDADPCVWAAQAAIRVIGEIEMAASVCPAPIIAITGTNGKTTTATLVGEVIRASGKRAFILGNIGRPFCAEVLDVRKEDFVSLEVSSFQLETIKDFRPRVAAILNVTPDHLDRYASVDEYLEAKRRIAMNQTPDDWLVLNYGDAALRRLAGGVSSKVAFFNKDASEGDFNQNQLAVLAIAGILGIGRPTCLEVFGNFKGVEHRMEFVRSLNGIEFINDSKATNIDSTIWALSNIKKRAVLIAGGRDKGSDFAGISDLVKQKIRLAILVGEASDRIASAWQGVVPLQQVKSFPEAVRQAYRQAKDGEIVLFSPMCKSFDMFTDYEHRGRVFKDLVNQF